ncbi:MAG: GNAT family N-acetyltransferase [Gemmatimonadota bacterium]
MDETNVLRRAKDWFETLELRMGFEEFTRLPRHPAYRYEYRNGHAVLTPCPAHIPVARSLTKDPLSAAPPSPAMSDLRIRQLDEGDWEGLPAIFAAAFVRTAPFDCMNSEQRMRAAQLCIARTRAGADGPLVAEASLVTYDPRADNTLLGALIVTRVPQTYGSRHTARNTDRTLPHLTWIFVHPDLQRRGTGRALLEASCTQLRALGDTRLASTFLIGNINAMLWHWSEGFLLASKR